MKNKSKYIVLLMAFVMMVAVLCAPGAYATNKICRFSDVPDSYWGAKYVEALADGGLINGYGNNTFGPTDNLRIDQICTIICKVKGHNIATDTGYWAYEAVRYCRDELRCLPDQGEITKANYNVDATRELAVYMLASALGSNDPNSIPNWDFRAIDIPDYSEIDKAYASSVLHAYQIGLIQGKDSEGTFCPKDILSRGELCTILYNANFIEAAETPVLEDGKTGEELFTEIQALGGWQLQATDGAHITVVSTIPMYGDMTMAITERGSISIYLPEYAEPQCDAQGNVLDSYGNPISAAACSNGYCDPETGKYLPRTSWSYESRQYVKDLFKLIFPTGYEEVYQALLGVMNQEIFEASVLSEKSPAAAIRWVDGRGIKIMLNSLFAQGINIYISDIGNTEDYDMWRAGFTYAGYQAAGYVSVNTQSDQAHIAAAYELARG